MKNITLLIALSLSLGLAGCGLFPHPMSKAHLFYEAMIEKVERLMKP